jgi:DNA adenine methylase
MPITDTPLRYPGGKSQLAPLVIDLLGSNKLFYGEYAEPFAGGAGIAMTLLLNDYVSRVYLNDIDPNIHAFWHSILHYTDAICDRIASVKITMEEWEQQRKIFLDTDAPQILEKGFATLFLNRTNRSGILRGGVIGGKSQNGQYKLDCRFNRADLIRKIRRIADYKDQIKLSRLDAVNFIHEVIPTTSSHTLINLDPPYFCRGPELYANHYKSADHTILAKAIATIDRHWMATYDDTPEIRMLYAKYPIYSSSLNYFAQDKRVGTELLILNQTLKAPIRLLSCRLESLAGV